MRYLICLTLVLAGCAADPNAAPDIIRRSKVINKNPASITIEHSELGRPIAFRMADEHCRSVQKNAVPIGTVNSQPDPLTTWRCE